MISLTLIEMCVQGGERRGELDCVDRILLREIPVPEALNESIHHEEGEGLAMKAFFLKNSHLEHITLLQHGMHKHCIND